MDTIFMNSGNSKTSNPHILLLNLSDKINLKRKEKDAASSNLSVYYTWKNTKKSYKRNKLKISASKWNETSDLHDGSHAVSGIQNYFEYILKNMEKRVVILQQEYLQIK